MKNKPHKNRFKNLENFRVGLNFDLISLVGLNFDWNSVVILGSLKLTVYGLLIPNYSLQIDLQQNQVMCSGADCDSLLAYVEVAVTKPY